jgi:hypothetical protein
VSAQPDVAAAVVAAIAELEAEYERVTWSPDGSGGAYVTATPVTFGERWAPVTGVVEVAVAFNYPFAPIYPFYTTETLERVDGGAWPGALQRVAWRGRQVTQISLRTTRWDPAHDTVSTALRMVSRWFQTTS